MIKEPKPNRLLSHLGHLVFRRKFSGPRTSVVALALLPLVAYPLTLDDYENTATVSPSADQFEVETTNNSSTIQVTPNAEIVIVKEVINNNGGLLGVSDFGISTDAGALTFDAGTAAGTTTTYTAEKLYVPPGTYTLAESTVDGYTEGLWNCSVGVLSKNAHDDGEITLAAGESTVCSIANNDIAPQLTLVVNVTNDNGGLLTASSFGPAVGSVPYTSGVAQSVLANTPLDVLELNLPGYTEGTWSCTDANNLTATAGLLSGAVATGGTTMSLAPGSDVTCTITNDDIAPKITLTKTIINDHGGNLTVDDFDITLDTLVDVPNGIAQTVAANTDINISEVPVAGYQPLGDWSCTDATGLSGDLPVSVPPAGGTSFQLAPGAVVNCALTNDDIQPTLTLVKNILNDNGGTGTIDDFDISIDDGTGAIEVSSGTANPVMANLPITISELDLTAYAEGSWSCSDDNGVMAAADLPAAGLATGTSVTLLPGAAVLCEITNNDLGIDLSIAKMVSNTTPNVGDTITFTLTVSNAGPDVATNVSVTDIVLAGFTYVPGSISGGSATDESDPAGTGLTWDIASVAVGSPVTLSFDVTVNAP